MACTKIFKRKYKLGHIQGSHAKRTAANSGLQKCTKSYFARCTL